MRHDYAWPPIEMSERVCQELERLADEDDRSIVEIAVRLLGRAPPEAAAQRVKVPRPEQREMLLPLSTRRRDEGTEKSDHRRCYSTPSWLTSSDWRDEYPKGEVVSTLWPKPSC